MSLFVLGVIALASLLYAYYSRKLLLRQKAEYKKLHSQKKQSEIRVGQIAEHFVPLLKEFKYNRKQARFLASPIDFIIFEKDEIIFMEVKTGKSQLNKNQRKIRDQIKNKQVRWEVLRIDPQDKDLTKDSGCSKVDDIKNKDEKENESAVREISQ